MRQSSVDSQNAVPRVVSRPRQPSRPSQNQSRGIFDMDGIEEEVEQQYAEKGPERRHDER